MKMFIDVHNPYQMILRRNDLHISGTWKYGSKARSLYLCANNLIDIKFVCCTEKYSFHLCLIGRAVLKMI